MSRAAPVVLGALVVLAGGCPDEHVPAAEGSTTGGSDDPSTTRAPGSSSVGGSFSGGLDTGTTTGTTTTDTTTTGTTTSEGSTTGGEPSSGHARVLVRRVLSSFDDIELELFEYAEGELASWISFTSDLPMGTVEKLVAESGRVVAFCKQDPDAMEERCFAIDLTPHPSGPAQPFFSDPLPADTNVSLSSWSEATQSFVFRMTDSGSPNALFSAAFPGGVLEEPELLAQGGPGQRIGSDVRVRSDGAWVSYVLGPLMGPSNAFVAPLALPDPGAAVMVSDVVDPELRATTPSFVTGQEAVLYTIGDGSYGSNEDSLWFVDLSGPVPTAPLRVDDPLPDGLGIRSPRIAPDGHALLYLAGEPGEGDLMFVDLTAGVPQPPVLVSSLVDEPFWLVRFDWSPDSRFITYLAETEHPDTPDLHIVEAPGAAPGEPVRITGVVPNGSVRGYAFDASSRWLYYVAEEDERVAQLYRVDVSGSEPGARQRVSGDDGAVSGNITGSHDWSTVLYLAGSGTSGASELYVVDVSRVVPGTAVRISPPLAEGIEVSEAYFSRDGSVALYHQTGPTGKDPDDHPVKLVDLTSGSVHTLAADALDMDIIID